MSAGAATAAAQSPGDRDTPLVPTHLGPAVHGDLQRTPARIIYTGDGTGFFAGPGEGGHRPRTQAIKWTQWEARTATGHGADWADNCNPNCAGGSFSAYAVSLRLSSPRVLDGYKVFTRLSAIYTRGRPSYVKDRHETFTLRYEAKGGGFFWAR